jgi:hypothetical protein
MQSVTACVHEPVRGGVWTAGRDRTIKVWDAATCALRRDLRGHAGPVTALAASAGVVWSASADHSVRVWLPSGECARVLNMHAGWVVALAPAPLGVWSAGSDRTVRLCELTSPAAPTPAPAPPTDPSSRHSDGRAQSSLQADISSLDDTAASPATADLASCLDELQAVRRAAERAGALWELLAGPQQPARVPGVADGGMAVVVVCTLPVARRLSEVDGHAAAARMTAFYRRVRDESQRAAGTEVAAQGDAVVVAFAEPAPAVVFALALLQRSAADLAAAGEPGGAALWLPALGVHDTAVHASVLAADGMSAARALARIAGVGTAAVQGRVWRAALAAGTAGLDEVAAMPFDAPAAHGPAMTVTPAALAALASQPPGAARTLLADDAALLPLAVNRAARSLAHCVARAEAVEPGACAGCGPLVGELRVARALLHAVLDGHAPAGPLSAAADGALTAGAAAAENTRLRGVVSDLDAVRAIANVKSNDH